MGAKTVPVWSSLILTIEHDVPDNQAVTLLPAPIATFSTRSRRTKTGWPSPRRTSLARSTLRRPSCTPPLVTSYWSYFRASARKRWRTSAAMPRTITSTVTFSIGWEFVCKLAFGFNTCLEKRQWLMIFKVKCESISVDEKSFIWMIVFICWFKAMLTLFEWKRNNRDSYF